MKRHKSVDDYIHGTENWQDELIALRKILTATDLTEEVKWGSPCYTHKGKNVVMLGAFKNHFGIWFYQGALLADKDQVLMNCQEGKTKAMRQWRMTSKKDIKIRAIKTYVKEAMELVEQGKEIKPDRNKPVVIPPQLKAALAKDKKAQAAFSNMTKGKQREYADYIADAKREATKETRLKKILPMITAGGGLNDKYKNR